MYQDGKEVDSTPNLPPVRRNDAPINIGAALWGEVAPETLHPTPYTLHPTPCTLHPTLYTPPPYTLRPTPYNLNPKP